MTGFSANLVVGVEDHDIILVEVLLSEVHDFVNRKATGCLRAVEETRLRPLTLRLKKIIKFTTQNSRKIVRVREHVQVLKNTYILPRSFVIFFCPSQRIPKRRFFLSFVHHSY